MTNDTIFCASLLVLCVCVVVVGFLSVFCCFIVSSPKCYSFYMYCVCLDSFVCVVICIFLDNYHRNTCSYLITAPPVGEHCEVIRNN